MNLSNALISMAASKRNPEGGEVNCITQLPKSREYFSPLHLLSNEVLANLCTFLPLKALAQLGQINKKFSNFLGSETDTGEYVWKLIANKIGARLIASSEASPKEQIKNLFIDLPEATVDLLNNKLIMKAHHYSEECIKEIFIKYVPNGYYLEYEEVVPETETCLMFDWITLTMLCRIDNQGKTLKRGGNLIWYSGDQELYESVKKTNKKFELIDRNKHV